MENSKIEAVRQAQDFMHSCSMTAAEIDMDESVQAFLAEMHKGLETFDASLHMIPTYLNSEGELPFETPVIVLDAGGTNFREAQVNSRTTGKL